MPMLALASLSNVSTRLSTPPWYLSSKTLYSLQSLARTLVSIYQHIPRSAKLSHAHIPQDKHYVALFLTLLPGLQLA